MTRRESRGWLIFVLTLISLISGSIIAYKQPESWHGLALLALGFVGCYLCFKRWQIASKATEEEKEALEEQEKETRSTIGMWLTVLFMIVLFLVIVAVGVGLVLNLSIGDELGHTIIQIAVIAGGLFAALWLGFLLFFA